MYETLLSRFKRLQINLIHDVRISKGALHMLFCDSLKEESLGYCGGGSVERDIRSSPACFFTFNIIHIICA